ncbi:MAG TPA: hypothetical protein VG603_13895 [Chitinophagales bacterium]|nr:hypothetical protein [Chitinophagales bacterium]
MAENVEQVVVQYKIDLTEAKKELAELSQQVKGLHHDMGAGAATSGKDFKEHVGKAVSDVEKAMKGLGGELKQALSDTKLKEAIVSLRAYQDLIDATRTRHEKLSKEYMQANAKLEELAKTQDKTSKEYSRAYSEHRALKEQLAKAVRDEGRAQDELKKAYTATSTELGKLDTKNKEATGTFTKAKTEVEKLQQAVNKAAADEKKAAGDISLLKNAAKGLEGLSDAFDGAVKGAEAMGIKSEALEKTSKNLHKAVEGVNTAIKIGDGLKQASTGVTQTLSAVQTLYTGAVEGTNVELQAARANLVSLGIGAVIALVALLISNWDKLKNAVVNNIEKIKKFTNTLVLLSPPIGVLIKGLIAIGEHFNDIKAIVSGVANVISAFFSSVSDFVTGLINRDLGKMTEAVTGLGNKMSKAYSKGVEDSYKNTLAEKQLQDAKDALKIAEDNGQDVYEAKKKVLEAELALLDKNSDEYKKKEQELTQFIKDENQKRLDDLTNTTIDRLEREKNILEAEGKDTYKKEREILNSRLSLYKEGSKDYLDIQNQIAVLDIEHQRKTSEKALENSITEMELKLDKEKEFGVKDVALYDKLIQDKIALAKMDPSTSTADIDKLISDLKAKKKEYEDGLKGTIEIEPAKVEALNNPYSTSLAKEDIQLVKQPEIKQHKPSPAEIKKQKQELLKMKVEYAFSNEAHEKWQKDHAGLIKDLGKTKEYAEKVTDVISKIGNAVFGRQLEQMKQQFTEANAQLDKWHSRSLELAGDNAKKRAAVERAYQAQQTKLKHEEAVKEAQIKRKQAEMDKAMALIKVAIDTALAIVKASPEPIEIALAAATGAAAAATIAAQPLPAIPKFAKGVVGFKGLGTETSDSNLIAISTGESIIKADATRRYEKELEAINSLSFETFLMDKYLKPALQNANPMQAPTYDDWLLRKDVREGNHLARKNAEYIVKGVSEAVKMNGYFHSRYHA